MYNEVLWCFVKLHFLLHSVLSLVNLVFFLVFYLQVIPDNDDQKGFVVDSRYLTACFAQPDGAANFLQRVADQNVVLKNCLINHTDMLITGSVGVANVAFHKKVSF